MSDDGTGGEPRNGLEPLVRLFDDVEDLSRAVPAIADEVRELVGNVETPAGFGAYAGALIAGAMDLFVQQIGVENAREPLLRLSEDVDALSRAVPSVANRARAFIGTLKGPAEVGAYAGAVFDGVMDLIGPVCAVAQERGMVSAGRWSTSHCCTAHGVVAWNHTILCQQCRRAFQWFDRTAPYAVTEMCPCGARLLPGPLAERMEPFSAEALCSICFVLATTRAPTDGSPPAVA